MNAWWKAHPKPGDLRTFLDGEHPARRHNAILLHLQACPECQTALAAVRADAELAAGAVARLRAAVAAAAPAPGFTTRKEGFPMILPLWRRTLPYTAAAAVVALLVTVVAVPATRTLAAQWLSIFRTERIATVQITDDQLRNAQRSAGSRITPELARQLAEVSGPAALPEPVPVSLAEAAAIAGSLHQPALPEALAAVAPEIWGLKPVEYQVKPDVAKVNDWLAGQGIPARLSGQLQGQTVRVVTPALVLRHWYDKTSGKEFLFAEGRGVQVSGTAAFDLQQLVDVVAGVVGVPADVTAQIRRIPNLDSTLVLPVTPSTGEPVAVGGGRGVHYALPGGSALVWTSDGKVFIAAGNFSLPELLKAVTW